MQAISYTTSSGSFEVMDRSEIVSVAGKKIIDRAIAVVESTGNNRALRMILSGEKGIVGKTMVASTVQEGWAIAIEHAANGSGYDAFIGKVALKLKRAMRNNRQTFIDLPNKIDDEILQGETGAKKMSEKAMEELRTLKAEIIEATALVNARYEELKKEKAEAQAKLANAVSNV